MRRRAGAVCVLLGSTLGGPSAGAQLTERSAGVIHTAAGSWTTAWSPLLPLADFVRTPPHGPPMLQLLDEPPPRVGLLWTAGSPAGLPDAQDLRITFETAGAATRGGYRRPFDAPDARGLSLAGSGWGPLSTRASVIGRATLGITGVGQAPLAVFAVPYRGDPIVPTDTTSPGVRRVTAMLEGGIGGWSGRWSAGFAVGTLVGRDYTRNATTPRIGRLAVPGVSAALSHALPIAGIRLALTGRWQGGAETVLLVGQPEPGIVYPLVGYSEPEPVSVSPQTPYLHRVNRDAWGGGLAAAGTIWNARWTVFAERAGGRNHHVLARRFHAPTDRWDARAWRLGAAVQQSMFRARLLGTVAVRLDCLRGDATRNDLPGVVYRTRDHTLDLGADLRWMPPRAPLTAGVVLSVRRQRHGAEDFLVPIASDVLAWTSGFAVEIAYTARATSVALGYGISNYAPVTSLPDPTAMGPVYVQTTGSALELEARRAMPMTATFAVRYRVSTGTALLLTARGYRVAPVGSQPLLALAPSGERLTGDVALAVTLTR